MVWSGRAGTGSMFLIEKLDILLNRPLFLYNTVLENHLCVWEERVYLGSSMSLTSKRWHWAILFNFVILPRTSTALMFQAWLICSLTAESLRPVSVMTVVQYSSCTFIQLDHHTLVWNFTWCISLLALSYMIQSELYHCVTWVSRRGQASELWRT